MPAVLELARFVVRASWDDLTADDRGALKLRILDSVGCAIGALAGEIVPALRAQLEELGGTPRSTVIGGGLTSPDRAAFHNGALIRYLDFNDSYLAPGETCHPSDNLAAVLAATEWAGGSGRDLLVALAVAYQVQCRLSEVAPVRDRGFDHTTQGTFAVAAGVAKALRLDATRTAHALAIAGTGLHALRVTRTGALSHWKGLAYPHMAFAATHAAFLAARGITGPPEVFEGNKGLEQTITGPFAIDWSREGLDRVRGTVLKRYDAEIHAQTAIEGLLELRRERPSAFAAGAWAIERIEVDVFDVAFRIIGGGEEGAKVEVHTKEEADHSLPYMLAAAALDGQLLPEQYAPARIAAADVQALLRRVVIRPDEALSRRFPAEHPCRIRVRLQDGSVLAREKREYQGFHTRPMRREDVLAKFEGLAYRFADRASCRRIAGQVDELDVVGVTALCAELRRLRGGEP